METVLETFRAGWRGRDVPDAPTLQAGRIQPVGILLGDSQPGPFVLDIDWIRAGTMRSDEP
ncbi:MAG: CIA30 family protein [Opitutales bacterium]